MRTIAAAVCLATALSGVPARAADTPPISLPKLSKWQMNYGDDTCQLAAKFGSAADSVIMEIRRDQPGDHFDLHLYGQRLKFKELTVPVELTFGMGGTPQWRDGTSLTLDGPPILPLVRVTNLRVDGLVGLKNAASALPPLTPAIETQITAITFKLRMGKPYRLETGSMSAPLAAMRACTDDLIKGWGYDPTVRSGLTHLPEPANNPSYWVTSLDFPGKSSQAGHNGLVRFRLDVDPAGRPTGCRILYRTNPDEFADLSCKLLLERARFKPALNAQAKPVKWFYINTIQWMSVL